MSHSVGQLVLLGENLQLGVCRIRRILNPNNTVEVQPLWGGETVTINTVSARMHPYHLHEGFKVKYDSHTPKTSLPLEVPGEGNAVIRQEMACEKGLRIYLAKNSLGEFIKLQEDVITPLAPNFSSPVETLTSYLWRAPYRFFSRLNLLQETAKWQQMSMGMPTLLGARVHLMPHQIYAAKRVLHDRSPRFILADEVGLGKTIETGLIIQALCHEKPDISILLITPGAMSSQWQCEMYLRFGARVFEHVDSEKCRKLGSSGFARILSSNKVIVSQNSLLESEKIQQMILEKEWDLIVTDEAHHIGVNHPLYYFIHQLSSCSGGFLALSATPSKRDVQGLLTLLSLVAPNSYKAKDIKKFESSLKLKRKVWNVLNLSIQLQEEAELEGEDLDPEVVAETLQDWDFLAKIDDLVQELINRIKKGEHSAFDELIAYVQEYYRVDHRIIRTRRKSLRDFQQHFSDRRYEILSYESAAEQLLIEHLENLPPTFSLNSEQIALRGLYMRLFCSSPRYLVQALEFRLQGIKNKYKLEKEKHFLTLLSSDLSPSEEQHLIENMLDFVPPLPHEGKWIDKAIRLAQECYDNTQKMCLRHKTALDWIQKHLKQNPDNKILIFSQESYVVKEFSSKAKKLLGDAAVVSFHQDMESEALTQAALWFQQRPDCRVLVSNELGGEGRNFQIASAVVHLDTPWSVGRLEQRIGRIDRLGRKPDFPVHSVVLQGPLEIETELIELHSKVFQVYERSIGGLEYLLPTIQEQLTQAMCEDHRALNSLAHKIQPQVEEALAQTDEDFRRSLDSSRAELEKAQEIAELVNSVELTEVGQALQDYAHALNIKVKLHGKSAEFCIEPEALPNPLPGIPLKGKVNYDGLFDRQTALKLESVQLFGPGHKLIDAMLASLRENADSKATIFLRNLGPEHQTKIFAVLNIRCEPNHQSIANEQGLSFLKHRLHSYSWIEYMPVLFEFVEEDDLIKVQPVLDTELEQALLAPYAGKRFERKILPEELVQRYQSSLSKIWHAVEQAAQKAPSMAWQQRQDSRQEKANRLEKDLRYEMAYFRSVSAKAKGEEKSQALNELNLRSQLVDCIRNEVCTLDSIALIYGARKLN
ncbi:MAG: helicase-related protein [Candidatus Sericytochromatia bacterium]